MKPVFVKQHQTKNIIFLFAICSTISRQMTISSWSLVTQQFSKHHFNGNMIPIQKICSQHWYYGTRQCYVHYLYSNLLCILTTKLFTRNPCLYTMGEIIFRNPVIIYSLNGSLISSLPAV